MEMKYDKEVKMRTYLLKKTFKEHKTTRVLAKSIDLLVIILLVKIFHRFGYFLAFLYLCISDTLFEGQSIGKKLLSLKVVSLITGEKCSIKQSILRNLPFSIPLFFAIIPFWGWFFALILSVPLTLLELYLVIKLDSSHRLGDVIADTTVVGPKPDELPNLLKKSWFQHNQNGELGLSRDNLNS